MRSRSCVTPSPLRWVSAQVAVAAQIGRLAGGEHPRLAALAQTGQQSSATADFDRALDLLLAGVHSASRSGYPLGLPTARR